MKSFVESSHILRITNRRARVLVERIVRQGMSLGTGRRPRRDFRIIEIKKFGGSDYFIGLKMDKLEFEELSFAPEDDVK